jgi:hypothetical protein
MRDIAPFGLRLPPELKQILEEAAETNQRSMNAELVIRLKESVNYRPLSHFSDGDLIAELLHRYNRGDIYIRIGKCGGEHQEQ